MKGFEFRETMAGSYELAGASARPRPMSFTVRARSGGLLGFLRKPIVEIEGEVDAEGLADHKPLRGTMDMDVLRKKTIAYAFDFESNDGAACSFIGKKTVVYREFAASMTVLPGVLIRSGEEIGRVLLRFDLRSDLVRFVRSFRPNR